MLIALSRRSGNAGTSTLRYAQNSRNLLQQKELELHRVRAFPCASGTDIIAWMNEPKPIQSISFSGHESFPLRFAWLTKAVRGVKNDPTLFAGDDAVVRLGVGKNMVRAIRHWATRADMIRPDADDKRGGRYTSTRLGDLLFGGRGQDPYLEDPATVWIVHWQLSSRRRQDPGDGGSCGTEVLCPTTWVYMFNEFRESWFTQETAVRELLGYAKKHGGKPPSPGTVERDLSCFIRSYTPAEPDKRLSREDTYDSPLTDLGLLTREPVTGRVLFDRGPRPTLPAEVFTYAVLDSWRREAPASETMSFQRIAYGPGGPGQVFKLSENACVEYLETLGDVTGGNVSYDATAGLRQAIRHGDIGDSLRLLRRKPRARKKGVTSAA